MTTPKRKIGDFGEDLAKKHLIKQGYTIVEQNWRCKMGELDIIAKIENITVFIEVKTRRTPLIEEVYMQYTPKKRDKLIRTIYAYLQSQQMPDSDWRFDMIAVALPYGKTPIIEQVEDALAW